MYDQMRFTIIKIQAPRIEVESDMHDCCGPTSLNPCQILKV